MRERKELTRAKEPAFLSEASIADVNEQLAAKLGNNDNTAKARGRRA